MGTYTVGADDKGKVESLSKIASKTGVKADDLFAANRELIGSNPANVAAGMTLVVPDKAEEEG